MTINEKKERTKNSMDLYNVYFVVNRVDENGYGYGILNLTDDNIEISFSSNAHLTISDEEVYQYDDIKEIREVLEKNTILIYILSFKEIFF